MQSPRTRQAPASESLRLVTVEFQEPVPAKLEDVGGEPADMPDRLHPAPADQQLEGLGAELAGETDKEAGRGPALPSAWSGRSAARAGLTRGASCSIAVCLAIDTS